MSSLIHYSGAYCGARRLRGMQWTAIGLAALLLALSAMMYPAMVPHSAHHAHHEATSHASALCSWMCAADHAADVGVSLVPVALAIVPDLHVQSLLAPDHPIQFARASRAPPVLTV
ncbi:MAG: hypothetical protein U0172_08645 [Nitrospiraceae bacterium]